MSNLFNVPWVFAVYILVDGREERAMNNGYAVSVTAYAPDEYTARNIAATYLDEGEIVGRLLNPN